MNNKNHSMTDLPDVNSILSSLVRLMSNYLRDPSYSQVMTLIRLLDFLEQHPDLSSFPAAEFAVKKARVTWNELLKESESRSPDAGYVYLSDATVH